MERLLEIDWQRLFVPAGSLLEVFVRGSVMYLALFAFLRILRREAGTIGIADMLVVVVLADAAQNALSGDHRSITEGILLVATILGWDLLLDWLSCRVAFFHDLVRPRPLLLIRDGQLQRRHMRQEMITQGDLISLLREQGISRIEEVKECFLEGDGKLSVIRKEARGQGGVGR